jgi:hypothetical protein
MRHPIVDDVTEGFALRDFLALNQPPLRCSERVAGKDLHRRTAGVEKGIGHGFSSKGWGPRPVSL